MKRGESKKLDRLFLKAFLKTSPGEVTDEEIAYFRDHPEQIDEITAQIGSEPEALEHASGELSGSAIRAVGQAEGAADDRGLEIFRVYGFEADEGLHAARPGHEPEKLVVVGDGEGHPGHGLPGRSDAGVRRLRLDVDRA